MTSQKLGLMMIAGALLAIAVIAAMFTVDADKRRLNEIRAEGVALARLLGSFQWQELAPEAGSESVLETLRARVGRSAFVYAAVIDESGKVHAYVGGPEAFSVETATMASGQNWLAEQHTRTPDGRNVLEFSSPLTRGDALAGTLRVGFLKPSFGVGMDDVSSIARLALPVFLLIPLFWYFLRREMKPLGEVGRRLDEVAARGFAGADGAVLEPSDDLRAFMQNFERFLSLAEARVTEAKPASRICSSTSAC